MTTTTSTASNSGRRSTGAAEPTILALVLQLIFVAMELTRRIFSIVCAPAVLSMMNMSVDMVAKRFPVVKSLVKQGKDYINTIAAKAQDATKMSTDNSKTAADGSRNPRADSQQRYSNAENQKAGR